MSVRKFCADLTKSFCIGVSSHKVGEKLRRIDGIDRVIKTIMEAVSGNEDLFDGLREHEAGIREIVSADGFVLFLGDEKVSFGDTFEESFLENFDTWFVKKYRDTLFQTNSLTNTAFFDFAYSYMVAGVLAIKIKTKKGSHIRCYWLRNEVRQEIHWAGNPNKPVVENAGVTRLSPRRSFERWIEEKSGYSLAWSSLDVLVAMKFSKALYGWI